MKLIWYLSDWITVLGEKYAGSLQWIEGAGIISRCYNLSMTELPLDGNAEEDIFKVYMRDCALIYTFAGMPCLLLSSSQQNIGGGANGMPYIPPEVLTQRNKNQKNKSF